MRQTIRHLAILPALICFPARADVVISSAATLNISCSGGVCAPTAADAVLNVTDLENLLASGNAQITTTGSGVQASNIEIEAPLTWSGSSALALDAWQSVRVEQPVTVSGPGGLSVTTNDGGSNGEFWFAPKGNITFEGTSNALSINGTAYTLIATLPELAAAITANPSGTYALAANYDAGQDGDYHSSPISTPFEGSFSGLGNVISNLTITANADFQDVGLFSEIDSPSVVSSLMISQETVVSSGGHVGFSVAGLAGVNNGLIFNSAVGGSVKVKAHDSAGDFGGAVGYNVGVIEDVATNVKLHVVIGGHDNGPIGGMAGMNEGVLEQSYSTGRVTETGSAGRQSVGGLLGGNDGTVVDCYSTSSTTEKGAGGATVGGLVGTNLTDIVTSYSTGRPGAASQSYVGGSVGYDASQKGDIEDAYWDTTTSGLGVTQGAGNVANDPGIRGKTTAQLQKALPKGFDPAIWAESRKINNGLPYLIDNPPAE